MKLLLPVVLVLLVALAALVRHNFIVIDGAVTKWQIDPILSRGVVRNDREYRAAVYYVEQIFEAGGFNRPTEREFVERLNVLLAKYHASKEQKLPSPRGGA